MELSKDRGYVLLDLLKADKNGQQKNENCRNMWHYSNYTQ